MLIAAAAIIVGFIILIYSADLFVAGAAAIAENMGMSPVIIGLTIVSMGTSAPEILVSLTASFAGAGELAIGNAIGSNIANIGLVLGITVRIAPLIVHKGTLRKEIVLLMVVTLGVGFLCLDGSLSRLDGIMMVAVLVFILIYLTLIQSSDTSLAQEADEEPIKHLSPLRAWLTFAIGLTLLIASSKLLVWGAVTAANILGVSELVIGLTVVAVGTSLPELAATVASAMRGHTEIALANVVGSNLFNLLAVMAIPGIIAAEQLQPAVITRDYPTMIFFTGFLVLAIYLSRKRSATPLGDAYLGRRIGSMLVSFYALYYYWLYVSI